MGSTTANDPNNYNISLIATPEFSEPLTTSPDSLVFWVKMGYFLRMQVCSRRLQTIVILFGIKQAQSPLQKIPTFILKEMI
jgi:hypothetical protein